MRLVRSNAYVSHMIRNLEVVDKRGPELWVEVEHVKQVVPVHAVQVAVGERAHVGRRLAHGAVLPERVAEHVALACDTRLLQLGLGKGSIRRLRSRATPRTKCMSRLESFPIRFGSMSRMCTIAVRMLLIWKDQKDDESGFLKRRYVIPHLLSKRKCSTTSLASAACVIKASRRHARAAMWKCLIASPT